MSDFTEARIFILEGPTAQIGGKKRSLWRASVSLAFLSSTQPIGNHQGFASAAYTRNHALRPLLERASVRTIGTKDIKGDDALSVRQFDFHDPRLLVAAVGSGNRSTDKLWVGWESDHSILGSAAKPKIARPADLDGNLSVFEQVVVAPLGKDWPFLTSNLAVPICSLVEGRIDLVIPCPTNPGDGSLAKLFGIDGGNSEPENGYRKALSGSIRIRCDEVAGKPGWMWQVSLTSEGIEFDAKLPDPFGASAAEMVKARVRLEAGRDGALRLVIVNEPKDAQWREKLDRLAVASRAKDSPIVFSVAPGITPFVWPVELKDGKFVVKEPRNPSIDAGNVLASLVAPPLNGGTVRAVCDLTAPRAQITAGDGKTLDVTIEAGADKPTFPSSRAVLTRQIYGKPKQLDVDLGLVASEGNVQPQPFRIDTNAVRREVDERRRAAGVSTKATQDTSLFLALERGVMQVPLPPITEGDQKSETAAPISSSLTGFLPVAVGANGASLVIDDAARTSAKLSFVDFVPNKAEIQLDGVAGSIDGIFWIADALPTPTEIIPTLAAGPIAVRSIPVTLATAQDKSASFEGLFEPIKQGNMPPSVSIIHNRGDGAGPSEIIHWKPLSNMPLMAAMNMTRTAVTAIEPSRTRDLVPFFHEVPAKGQATIKLTTSAPALLPTAQIAITAPTTIKVGWPQIKDNSVATVPMASVTLPGIEMRPQADFALEARARHDLPVLGELFANTAPPKGETDAGSAPTASGATALDMTALDRFWKDQARKLALTRTQDDLVFNDWFAPSKDDKTHKVKVLTLARPWTWDAAFAWRENAIEGSVSLGAMSLGEGERPGWVGGETALAGLSQDVSVKWSDKGSDKTTSLVVRGNASARYVWTSGAVKSLVDGRGFGPAVAPPAGAGTLSERPFIHLTKDAETTGRLAGTNKKLQLQINEKAWGLLSFRDLPLNNDGQFIADKTPEAALGPETGALDLDRSPDAGYEWRLHRPPGKAKTLPWDIPFGPFFARPLRLWSVTTTKDGVTAVTVICDVDWRENKTQDETQHETQDETQDETQHETPFGDDAPYRTGNPIALRFEGTAGTVLQLTDIWPVVVDKSITINEKDPQPAQLIFSLHCRIGDKKNGDKKGDKKDEIAAKLAMELRVVDKQPQLANASLSCRLFGSDRVFTGGALDTSTNAKQFAFNKPGDVKLVDAGVEISSVNVYLGEANGPRLSLAGSALVVDDHKEKPPKNPLKVASVGLDGAFQWFGTKVKPDHPPTIDHQAGTLWFALTSSNDVSGSPIRGLPVPNTAKANVAMAFEIARVHKAENAFIVRATATHASVELTDEHGFRINHRFERTAAKINEPQVRSNLLVSFSNKDTERAASAIKWPIDAVKDVAALKTNTFVADTDKNDDFAVEVTISAASNPPTVSHSIAPMLRDLSLSLDDLATEETGEAKLLKPWHSRVAVKHEITFKKSNNTQVFEWTGLDDIAIVDVQTVVESKDELKNPDKQTFAFGARYTNAVAHKVEDKRLPADKDEVPIAGTVRVGLVPRVFRDVLVGQGGGNVSGLMVLGGGVTRWRFKNETALVTALPWLRGIGDAKLGPLASIAQAPQTAPSITMRVASADLAAAIPYRTSDSTVVALATGDGGALSVEKALLSAFGPGALERTRAVDRAFAGAEGDEGLDNESPPNGHRLARPIFWRALLVLARVFGERGNGEHGNPEELKSTDAFVSTRATDTAALVSVASPTAPLRTPPTFNTIMTLERSAVTWLPIDWRGSLEGERRQRVANLVLARVRDPLLAALAELDGSSGDTFKTIRSLDQILLPPARLAPLLAARPRLQGRTVHPSARLGWPVEPEEMAALHLGTDIPIQDRQYAWSGRVSTVGSVRAAYATTHTPIYFALGERALFTRQEVITVAPPDRALQPAASRARFPLTKVIEEALKSAGAQENAIAPISPGPFEIALIGGRPGIVSVRHMGSLIPIGIKPFDKDNARFGRPAGRGPLVWGADRLPRSSGLPVDQRLDHRRRTYVDENILDAKDKLAELLVLSGAGSIVRFRPSAIDQEDKRKSVALVIDVIGLENGTLGDDWAGQIALRLRLPRPAELKIANVLAALGWAPATTGNGPVPLRASLTVGDAVVTFRSAKLADSMTLTLNAELAKNPAAKAEITAVRAAILAATPETKATLSMRWPGELGKAEFKGNLNQEYSLSLTPMNELTGGLPRALDLPLALLPRGRPSLPLPLATLVFADPAYDRELSGAALLDRKVRVENRQGIETKVSYLLSVDRLEYDVGETIHLALGELDQNFDSPSWSGGTPFAGDKTGTTWTMSLKLQSATRPDGTVPPTRDLRVRGFELVVVDGKKNSHKITAGTPHAIPVAALEAIDGEPLLLSDGDRVEVKARCGGTKVVELSVALGIVGRPVISPPNAIYALVTLDNPDSKSSQPTRATTALFASAPMPTRVEFSDAKQLLIDLARGYVRRQAIFVWSLAPRSIPENKKPFATLVKIDGTGGGQITDGVSGLVTVDE